MADHGRTPCSHKRLKWLIQALNPPSGLLRYVPKTRNLFLNSNLNPDLNLKTNSSVVFELKTRFDLIYSVNGIHRYVAQALYRSPGCGHEIGINLMSFSVRLLTRHLLFKVLIQIERLVARR